MREKNKQQTTNQRRESRAVEEKYSIKGVNLILIIIISIKMIRIL